MRICLNIGEKSKNMKVLIIDPWCCDDYEVYTIGFCEGMSAITNLTLVCNYYQSLTSKNYSIIPVFFRISQKMNNGTIRKIIRGLEYFVAYLKILTLANKREYDVIHIQWALFYKVDIFFCKLLKKYTKKLVYTSHNVVPHIDGTKHTDNLKRLHNVFDYIIVHGEEIKKEYLSYFPEDIDKLIIQRHGIHYTQRTDYDDNNVDKQLSDFINLSEGRKVCFVGGIFYNKGVDRLLKIWRKLYKSSQNTLVVAGVVTEQYHELKEEVAEIKKHSNILFLPRRMNDDEFSFIIDKSDLVVIPYRHASMSGIVYSAAAFSKPILYTKSGAIGEYVNDTGCFEVDNDDKSLEYGLTNALSTNRKKLSEIGRCLHNRIYSEYGWNTICQRLYDDCYTK